MPTTQNPAPPSVWKTGLAFRPFFWFGSLYLICALFLWLLFWRGQGVLQPLGGMVWWHQHEMLFGFIGAIIAGFLLTAVQSWTNRPSITGPALGALVLLWLAARFFIAFPQGLNPWWIVLLDMLFLPMVALIMAILVIKAKKWRNLAFSPLLLLLAGANFAMHQGHLNTNPQLSQHSAYLSVWLIVGLIVLLGGRVIPFFTSRALGLELKAAPKIYNQSALFSSALICLSFAAQLLGFNPPTWVLSLLLLVFIVANSIRLCYWQPWRCCQHPLLWSLHLSYGFIILGALFWLTGLWWPEPRGLALHLLTIGGMLAIVLAMIARVSLGHTGRTMQALSGFSPALGCVFIAALVRTIGPVLLPTWTLGAYQLSLWLCIAAFAWFLWHYTTVLWRPRTDLKPG